MKARKLLTKTCIFRDMTPYSLLIVDPQFGGNVASISRIEEWAKIFMLPASRWFLVWLILLPSLDFRWTTRRYILENNMFHNNYCEILKSCDLLTVHYQWTEHGHNLLAWITLLSDAIRQMLLQCLRSREATRGLDLELFSFDVSAT
jgi:hypothetical protein